MSVENLQSLSFGLMIAAAVMFVISIVMFLGFHIPRLFSELTGAAERKEIAEIQKRSEKGETGNVIERASVSEQLYKPAPENKKSESNSDGGTVKLATRRLTASNNNPVSEINTSDNVQTVDNDKIPVISPDTQFTVIEEISFTGSTEIIE